ncbi:hypothetical protein D9758_011887 [Tetrapyrgos nigripes]|uniref:Cytochrome P450 n=1 Tax=Tetrapyrgos nigripes TaxID=182062 RepID=A0A8H5FQD8_9AGAR|nr:hypothetical protein D9758_011887 [Tetrapyrgos nigripes]
MLSMFNVLLSVVCIALGVIVYRKRGERYPPGPRGLPLLGNLFQVPIRKNWVDFHRWQKEYGPFFYLNLAGQPVLVLNTRKVAVDLLERRAANYSSRPRFIVSGEYLNGRCSMILVDDGDLYLATDASFKRICTEPQDLNPISTLQSDEAALLAYDLIRSPEQWSSHILRSVISSIMSLVYDLPPLTSLDDPTIVFLLEAIARLDEAIYPGNFAVEFIPILDWLPPWMAKWKRDAIRDHKVWTAKFEKMFDTVKSSFLTGETEQSSFCATLLKPEARHGLNDFESAWLAASLFMAGYETSSSSLMWFMYHMILFPEVQAKAQEQLDQVVGRSRVPSFTDAKHLPYIWAIIKEMLRWRPPAPIAVPHATSADDYYEGYFIPKGTLCIPNVWSINRDPEVFGSDVEDFRPERHLDANGNLKDALDEGHFAFGFGHRSCVGRHVANNTLFIDIATVLWSAKILPVKDANGKPIVPSVDQEVTDGILLHPPECQFNIVSRFDEVEMILQQAREDVMKSTRYSRD